MDSLHLIRAAAEFADTLERDAQTASASQLQRTEEEVRARQRELQEREAEVERYRVESERQRAEMRERGQGRVPRSAREVQCGRDPRAPRGGDAWQPAARAVASPGDRLMNSARAEVEQTLEWARAQATAVMARAQKGAEQLLAAAGLGEPAIAQVVQSIAERTRARSRAAVRPRRCTPARSAEAPSAPSPSSEPRRWASPSRIRAWATSRPLPP